MLRLFPDVYYAISFPVFLGTLLLSATLVTLGTLLARDALARRPLVAPKAKAS